MRVAITGRDSALRRALEQELGGGHEVRVLPAGDLRDEAFSKAQMEGVEALIHLAPLDPDLPADASEREVLDVATRGTYVLLNAAVEAGVRRVVLGSSLALFEPYPASWSVSESWQPLPDVTQTGQAGQGGRPADVQHLALYLAEEAVKQFARTEPLMTVGLRFGQIVDDAAVSGKAYDPRWLHVSDAVAAVRAALEVSPGYRPPRPDGSFGPPRGGWWVYHVPGSAEARWPIGSAGASVEDGGLGYKPQHVFPNAGVLSEPSESERSGDLSVLEPRHHIPDRPIRNVVIFGAGGPLAAVTAQALAGSYRLRLTDVRPIGEIAAEAKPQSTGAPLPEVPPAPHETRVVDVTDLEQVLAACEGMDAIINCTVVRPHPVNAFLVNFIGAYNVMRAAVAHNIRRVVHTGPFQIGMDRPAGYGWDFDVPDDAPGRPGTWLYGISKYLGQETVRLFAEQYDLSVPALFYCIFANPQTARTRTGGVHPMTISWEDAGLAMRRALEVPELPGPFEIMHILADLPHGKYSNAKAKRLLGWQPRDSLANLWARRG